MLNHINNKKSLTTLTIVFLHTHHVCINVSLFYKGPELLKSIVYQVTLINIVYTRNILNISLICIWYMYYTSKYICIHILCIAADIDTGIQTQTHTENPSIFFFKDFKRKLEENLPKVVKIPLWNLQV